MHAPLSSRRSNVTVTVNVTAVETVQEGRLRLAVLLDLIDDRLEVAAPVGAHLSRLRMEYERHARHQERVLAHHRPHLVDGHRRAHDHMRALLGRLGAEHACGGDIRPTLRQVVEVFAGHLFPADAVFTTIEETTSRPA